MNILLAVVILVVLAASLTNFYVVRAALSPKIDQPTTQPDHPSIEELAALRAAVADLTLAVDEGIRRVDRAENRIQRTVTSARRLVRENGLEHAAIEAEFEELQPEHAEEVQPLPPLPETLEETRTVRVPGGELTVGAA